MSFGSQAAQAQSVDLPSAPPTCQARLEQCAGLIDKCAQAIQIYDMALGEMEGYAKLCEERNQGLNAELFNTQKKLESPLRNPFIMGTVGIVIGILVMGIAQK